MNSAPHLTLITFALLLCSPSADASPDDAASDGGLFTFVLENDVFGESKQDRNYTNGFKLGWMTPKSAEPKWAGALADALTPTNAESDTRLEFEIGQSMFTPGELSQAIPDPTDRPYAGLAYVSMGLVDRQERGHLVQYQLVLGIVGPSSRAKEVQRGFHELINAREPLGWDTQLRDQFVGELRVQHSRRMTLGNSDSASAYGIDVTPHAGATLGNLTTSANAGFGLRFGRNLPDDVGPQRISPGLPGSGYFEPTANIGWYLFGGLDVRYVSHSHVLDEPSRLGAMVQRTPWVADLQGGVAFHTRTCRVAYTQILRTKEFETQGEESSFGALSITWRY